MMTNEERDSNFVVHASQQDLTFATKDMLGYAISPRLCAYLWWIATARTSAARRRLQLLTVLRMVGVFSANIAFYRVGPWHVLSFLLG